MSEPSAEKGVVIESQFLQMGDRIVVEPHGGADFEAIVVMPLGWGLVHGVMNWQMRRDDNGDRFTYGIHVNTPVTRLPPTSATGADQ